MLAPAPWDPRPAARPALGGGSGDPAGVERCSFLLGPGRDLGTRRPELRATEAGERKSWGRWGTLATAATRYSEWNGVGNRVALLFVLAVRPEPVWWP